MQAAARDPPLQLTSLLVEGDEMFALSGCGGATTVAITPTAAATAKAAGVNDIHRQPEERHPGAAKALLWLRAPHGE
jgi:hypothetical protein